MQQKRYLENELVPKTLDVSHDISEQDKEEMYLQTNRSLNSLTANEEQNVYAGAVLDHLKRSSMIENDTRTNIFGMAKTDSQEMTNIKLAQKAITDLLFNVMSPKLDVFSNQISQIELTYLTLIHECSNFLDKNKKNYRQESKNRYKIISETLQNAKDEHSRFRETAMQLHSKSKDDTLFFINVLGEMRTSQIHFDRHKGNIKKLGNGTSTVYKVGENESAVFLKEEEYLIDPNEKVKALYPDDFITRLILELFNSPVASLGEDNGNLLRQGQRELVETKLNYYVDTVEPFNQYPQILEKANMETYFERIQDIFVFYTSVEVASNAGITLNSNLSKRNVATSRLATLLGQSNLVASSKTVDVFKEGSKTPVRFNAMSSATGRSMMDIIESAKSQNQDIQYSPEYMKKASNLWLLDMISGQIDRNLSNVFATTHIENNTVIIDNIIGIDNDMSFGQLTANDIRQRTEIAKLQSFEPNLKTVEINGKSELVSQDRVWGLDAEFCEAVQNLDIETINYHLCDILSKEELLALETRLDYTKSTIERYKSKIITDWNAPIDLTNIYDTIHFEKKFAPNK